MSAYNVSTETINSILGFLKEGRDKQGEEAISFQWQIEGFEKKAGMKLRTEKDFQQLGRKMRQLNARAVAYRYDEPEFKSSETFHPTYYDPYQTVKSIDCITYQMSEGDVPKEKLYKALEKLGRDMASSLIRQTKEYDTRQWDMEDVNRLSTTSARVGKVAKKLGIDYYEE